MSITLIDIGATANDGTGEALRDAFDKTNGNLTELDRRLHSAAANPTVNDDGGDGYQVGTLWENTSTGEVFACRSVASGAAVWTGLSAAQHPGFRTNEWWSPHRGSVSAGSATSNAVRLFPFMVPRRITVSDVGVAIHTTGVANVAFAIYQGNKATCRPVGNPLATTSNVSGASSPATASLSSAITFEVGELYFFAVNNSANLNFTSPQSISLEVSWMLGSTTLSNLVSNGFNAGLTLSVGSVTLPTWPDMSSGSTAISEIQGTAVAVPFFKISNAAP